MNEEQQKKEVLRFQTAVDTIAQTLDRISDLRQLWTAADLTNEITTEVCDAMSIAKQDIVDSNNLFDALIANGNTYVNLISRLRKDLDYPPVR